MFTYRVAGNGCLPPLLSSFQLHPRCSERSGVAQILSTWQWRMIRSVDFTPKISLMLGGIPAFEGEFLPAEKKRIKHFRSWRTLRREGKRNTRAGCRTLAERESSNRDAYGHCNSRRTGTHLGTETTQGRQRPFSSSLV